MEATLTVQQGEPLAQLSPVMDALIRLASDPNFKPENLAAIIAMQERAEQRNAEITFARDFAAAKKEIPRVAKHGVKDMGDKGKIAYATYDDVFDAIVKVEIEYGFTRSFTSRVEAGKNIMICTLMHRDGHKLISERQDAGDKGPGRNDIQADGSTMSYQRRYMSLMVWDVVTKGADDDGQRAGAIAQDQVDQILTLCTQLGWTSPEKRKPFLAWLKVAKVQDIQADDYDKAVKELMRRAKEQK